MFLLISVQSAAVVGVSMLAITKSPISNVGLQNPAGFPVPAFVTAYVQPFLTPTDGAAVVASYPPW